MLIDEDIVFSGCQSERKVVANGTNDGFNMTFRVRKDAAKIAFTVEGENDGLDKRKSRILVNS